MISSADERSVPRGSMPCPCPKCTRVSIGHRVKHGLNAFIFDEQLPKINVSDGYCTEGSINADCVQRAC